MTRNGGYAAIWRRLYDDQHPLHPQNTGQECSIREAFTDLILRAQYEPTGDLERGHFRASVRKLAEAWNVHRRTAERYLKYFREEGMVELVQEGTNKPSVYTLPAYETWQPPFGTRGGTPNGTADGTPPKTEYSRVPHGGSKMPEAPFGTPDGTADGTRRGTPTLLYKKKNTHTGGSDRAEIVRRCWERWKDLNDDWWSVEQMKLTSKRRKKLKALYDEQLHPRSDEHDPVELFEKIVRAARSHSWWGTDRSKVKVETLFRNAERREERTLEALDGQGGRRGPQRPQDRML